MVERCLLVCCCLSVVNLHVLANKNMAKLSFFIFLASLALVTVTLAADSTDTTVIADLIKRGDAIIARARTDLKNLQSKQSYFVQPLEDEIHKVEVFLREIEKLAKENKLPATQLGLVEARLLRYENDLLTILLIEEEAAKDLTFTTLVQMVEKLLNRAYADLGKLVTDQGAEHRLVFAIRAEIIALRATEDEVKRLNAGHPEEKTIAAVEKLLKHETALENLLFLAEHESILNPKF